MEARLLEIEFLEKCGVFWSQLSAEIEDFQLHLVTTAYGEGAVVTRKAECWTLVLTIVRVIWRKLKKVRLEAKTEYGSDNPSEMVGQYLWGTLQADRVTYDFLRTQFLQQDMQRTAG